jgi:hypothetical protein
LLALIETISPEVDALGFAGIAERFNVLRIALNASSTNAIQAA